MSKLRTLRLAAIGQVDAGMASIATFVLHIWVVREFSLTQIGAWGLVFAAFVNASQVPVQFHLTPVEISSVPFDQSERLGILRSSLWRGSLLASGASLFVAVGALPLVGDVEPAFLLGLVLSGMAACVVSPLQDHIRRTMHLAGKSAVAATMSVIQAVIVISGIFLLPAAWLPVVPFGALTVANIVSSAFGTLRVRFWRYRTVTAPGVREASRVGGWLTGVTVAGGLTGYLTNLLIKTVTNVETLGMVEAARVIARPVQVVGQGVSAVLSPQSMEAAVAADGTKAVKNRKTFFGLITLATVPIVALILIPFTRGLAAAVVPAALEDPGLATATVLAFWLASLYLPYNAELLGGGLHKRLAYASGAVALVQLAGVLIFAGAGAFVFPLAVGVAAVTRLPIFHRIASSIYRGKRVA